MSDTKEALPDAQPPEVEVSPPTGLKREESDGETKIKVDEKSQENRNKAQDREGGEDDEEEEGEETKDPPERSESRESETEKTDRPKSSDSTGDRPKSSASAEIFIGRRRKKKQKIDPDARQVTFTVTISIAVPTVEDEDVPDIKQLMKKKKQVFEAPKAQNYYRLEYKLTPEDTSLQRVDIVVYGPAAIVFLPNHDPKVLRTWQDGELTWIAWSQKHVLNINKEMLLTLFRHQVELRLWEGKDKVASKVRFIKPKQFKVPAPKPGEEDQCGARSIVVRQSKSFAKLQPKKANEIRPIPTQVSFHSIEKPTRRREAHSAAQNVQGPGEGQQATEAAKRASVGSATPKTLVAMPTKDADGRNSFSRLGRLAQAEHGGQEWGKESYHSKSSSNGAKKSGRGEVTEAGGGLSPRPAKTPESSASALKQESIMKEIHPKHPRVSKKKEIEAQLQAEHIKKYGSCMIPIRMATLFSGLKSVTNRLDAPVPGFEDVFLTVKLDVPLMSDEQRKELNPMIITIQNATNLPDTPLPYDELALKCQPVYCKYQFFKQADYFSVGRDHRRNIYWDDINVVLLGTLEPSELRQYLNGPPLEVELHDRDRKPEDVKLKPTLFGDDLEDEKISNVGTVASRRTVHNPFKGRNKPWDPYGVAKLDLSELLLGHSYLHLKVPVHNCRIPEVLTAGNGEGKGDNRLVGVFGAVDGPVDKPFNAGHYVQSNTMLKVKVELANPLATPEEVSAKQPIATTQQCPFGRIIFMFDYKNTALLNQLQSLVTEINAHALELDDMPQHVINAALSTYKLSLEQQRSRDLNIVTGFQVMDGDLHIFVLEGLRDRAVRAIWEALPCPENSDVQVLFNSDLSFGERLYGPLDVDLCRIKLHEPLSQIVQQPLLYVRDMVPKPCFEALSRLHQLTQQNKMKDVVRNSLIPSADMVISMSKEFGVPLTQEDFEELQPQTELDSRETEVKMSDQREMTTVRETSRVWTPIDNFNHEYMEKITSRELEQGTHHDFIKENKDMVKGISEINKAERDARKVPTVKADVKVAHNYSTQTLNSTDLAKEKLRQMLAENPDTRYTYCQDYHHSMTVVPVNVEALKKQEEAEHRAKFRTEKGWIYPGMKSMLECNVHPRRPVTARVDELREEWRENILHVGMLQPPLARDNLPWEHRKYDFELYKRPQSCFIREPITIHMAGQKLKEEKLVALRKDFETWKSKVVVKDTRQYIHRCLKETELQEKGPRSQNQIDKLQGLLKDRPTKMSLRKRGLVLKDVPPLNVVLNPSVDTQAREAGLPTLPAVENEGIEKTNGFKPGPYEGHSWYLERNKVPIHDYEHTKYAALKGADFNAIHTERAKLWKHHIVPLEDWERENHLFRIPDDPARFGPYESIEPQPGNTALPPVENPMATVSQVMTQSLNVLNEGDNSQVTRSGANNSMGTMATESGLLVNSVDNVQKMEALVS